MSIRTATAILFLIAPIACHAQIGGAAPMPQIRQSAGPSLQDTLNFIVEKFQSEGPAYYVSSSSATRKEYFRTVSADGCKLSITERAHEGDRSFSLNYYKLHFLDLKELDTNRIHTYPDGSGPKLNVFVIETLGDQKVIRSLELGGAKNQLDGGVLSKYHEMNKSWTSPVASNPIDRQVRVGPELLTYWHGHSDQLYLRFPELDTAERLGAAFKHAITLCQAQVLKDRPARPKELF